MRQRHGCLTAWLIFGFYGLVVSTLIGFVINIAIGTNIAEALVNLVGLAILYGVLQIGDTNKGWPQLE